ncbi:MAG: L-fucose/L-arabinose isomerase family protein [Caldilinea sp.]
MKRATQPVTVGLIVGNRGFFPAHLAESGRKTMLQVLEAQGFRVIALSPEETLYGSVVSHADSHKCADLFKHHRDEIDGVIVTLPNFGEERAIADTLRWAGLDVPVLIQAFPDDPAKMTVADRRDSFCGKMSACNNLRQYGIRYSLTRLHTVDPESAAFRQDLERFAGICRIVRGFKNARIGVIGARPTAFNTVRFSEKLLERSGISVETLDLSEVLGRIDRLDSAASSVKGKLDQIGGYIQTAGVPAASLLRMAKFGVVVDEWMAETELTASAIQCWTAMEEYYGVVPCTLMSIMSDGLLPSACETDIAGTVAMMALAYASGKPSAIVDWNNNYGDDPDKAIIFHCSNLPKSIFVEAGDVQASGGVIRADDIAVMDYQEIIAGTVGKDNTFGTVVGRVKADPFTYLRVSTDDSNGRIVAYVGEGTLTNDPLKTFGGYGVVQIPNMQKLLNYICENGFEHHVAMNLSQSAASVHEALAKYLGWSTYWHTA